MKIKTPVRFVPATQLADGTAYYWQLFRFRHMKRLGRSGFFPYPAERLANGFSASEMAAQLNAGHDFGFPYVQTERDVLKIINVANRSEFICLRFVNNEWSPGVTDPNWEVLDIINYGEAIFPND